MIITGFFPLFALLLMWSLSSPKNWLKATIVCATFQAASPFLLVAAGRFIGMTPAYLMLAVGFFHVFNLVVKDVRASGGERLVAMRFPKEIWALLLFSMYAVLCAVLAPKVFAGDVKIMSPREGISVSAGLLPLRFGMGNVFQSVYIVFNFLLCFFAFFILSKQKASVKDVIKGCELAVWLIVLVGAYQMVAFSVGLYWPSEIINSNAGGAQSFDQFANGVKRVSATFVEPSVMAMHSIGLLGLMIVAKRHRLLIGGLALMLLLTSSTTAIVGCVLLFATYLFLSFKKIDLELFRRITVVIVGGTLMAVLLLAFDTLFFDGQYLEKVFLNKLSSNSGVARSQADFHAVGLLFETYGIGVGVGSNRASSWLANTLASNGLFGIIFLVITFACVIRILGKSASDNDKAISVTVLGMLIGAMISVPDLAMPFMWLLLGVCIAISQTLSNQGANDAIALSPAT
ncbi:hypothetical protein K0504_05980 [Neiella marina]|uniref:Uncharacterized protein n=1 Tax=Neiella holothuriorum TaxID=2870530 RepID=A0ABS7EEB5_9GAMM|nr:hypothetical protein [Neiella holothuriorum]MBW8190580.1 hypothetical protein [Neiella holothuriorum]